MRVSPATRHTTAARPATIEPRRSRGSREDFSLPASSLVLLPQHPSDILQHIITAAVVVDKKQ
jgi:hypothetical protein